MKIQCEYCGSLIEDTDENCSYCGAPNENLKRYIDKDLDTIEELKQWYKENYFPSEDLMRFFIGKNRKTPNSFGIYKKGDKFIVYQNSDDGSRTIYYEGPDEAYAVNIIALRLKEVVFDQKVRNLWTLPQARNPAERMRNSTIDISKGKPFDHYFISGSVNTSLFVLILLLIPLSVFLSEAKPKPKHNYFYASSPDNIYHYYNYDGVDTWYKYKDGDWIIYDIPYPDLIPPGISVVFDDYETLEEIEEKYGIDIH